jgi:hypothetical protein
LWNNQTKNVRTCVKDPIKKIQLIWAYANYISKNCANEGLHETEQFMCKKKLSTYW